MFLVPIVVGGGLGIFGVKKWMDHRHAQLEKLRESNFTELQYEIAKKIYNEYFMQLQEATRDKVLQKQYGDSVFRHARPFVIKNMNLIPNHVNDDMIKAGGLKHYILPFVEQQIANMFLEIDDHCLEHAFNLSQAVG